MAQQGAPPLAPVPLSWLFRSMQEVLQLPSLPGPLLLVAHPEWALPSPEALPKALLHQEFPSTSDLTAAHTRTVALLVTGTTAAGPGLLQPPPIPRVLQTLKLSLPKWATAG